jgi:hypothetical protein
MSTNQAVEFGGLYEGMWGVFKSCYGAVLGWSLLVGFVQYILLLVSFRTGLSAEIAFACFWLVCLLVMVPLTAHLKYDVVRRARRKRATNGSSPEPAKPKMYGSVVLVGLFPLVLFLPSTILFFAGLPTEVKEFEWAALSQNRPALQKLISGLGQKGQVEEKGQQAEAAGKKDEANQLQKEVPVPALQQFVPSGGQAILAILGLLLGIVAWVALLTWVPWALIALLDPRTDVTSAGAALRYARELTAGTCSGAIRWSILGVFIVTGLIAFGSIILCCIGIYFLGLPLTFAFGPGLYLAMRGE